MKAGRDLDIYELVAARVALMAEPRHLLDLRCGRGELALRLSQRFPACRVTGLDPSSDAVRQASMAAAESGLSGRLHFEINDKRTIPLADASVDLITGVGALAHSTLPQGLLTEMDRVLIPGGCVILVEPIFDESKGAPPPNLPLLLNQEAPRPPEAKVRGWIERSPFRENAGFETVGNPPQGPALVITLQRISPA